MRNASQHASSDYESSSSSHDSNSKSLQEDSAFLRPLTIRQKITALLKQHYSASLDVIFPQFKLGAMMFFTGMVLVYISLKSMSASWQQELALLVGLLIAGSGFLLAMLAQIRFIISRFVRFFND